MGIFEDLSGQTFGKWTVLRRAINHPSNGQPMFLCRCICDAERSVNSSSLKAGQSKSCGCDRKKYAREGTKLCGQCRLEKPSASFFSRRGKLSDACRQCVDKATADRELRESARQRALLAYGAACACCGEKAEVFLAFDHKNGGGTKHRKTIGFSQLSEYLECEGFPDSFQVLCSNCNWAKHVNGICPHQIERAVAALSMGA